MNNFFRKDRPVLIAEISANHNGRLINAKKLILCAKKNGADAVKLQTYEPESITIDSNREEFFIKKGLWKGTTLWNLYKKAHTPFKWHKELFNYAKKINIFCFSSVFDQSSLKLLEGINCPVYKIASSELTDIYLIKKVASTGKPIILSTGMASINEIAKSVEMARLNNAKDITLLYCVSNYPSKAEEYNLYNIKILKDFFKCKVGLSDHSLGSTVATLAISMGATVIEKHIALQNQKLGLDIDFSLKGNEISIFKKKILEAYYLINRKYFFRSKSESYGKKFRRSIYAIKNINKNEEFNELNIKCIRPAKGINPGYYEKILGRMSPKKISKGTPLTKDIILKLKIK
jgi:pseudaminic acid synthase